MITFQAISSAGRGENVVTYYTQNKPDSNHNPAAGDPRDRITAYYTGRNSRAAWRRDMSFAIARALGINPNQAPKDADLKNLYEGKRADNGQQWVGAARRLSAYDFTFSPHKSVSLAAEFAASPAEAAAIRHAVAEANDDVMRYIAREIGWARKGKAGQAGADPGEVAWASFTHYDSRPTLPVQDGRGGATVLVESPIAGDPLDHIHNTVFNLVVTDEGRIGSLDTSRLQSRVHEFGAYGQARLAERLRALGIRTGYDDKESAVVVLAIPQIANDLFSKNRQQILRNATAFATSQGLDWDDLPLEKKKTLIADAARAARRAKHGDKSDHQVWREQAAAIGWEHTTVMEDVKHQILSDEERFDKAYQVAARHLAAEFHTSAIIGQDKLRLHAARGLIMAGIQGGVADIDRVANLIKERGIEFEGERADLAVGKFVTPGQKGTPKPTLGVTHTAQLRIEQSLVAEVRRAALDTSGALPTAAVRAAIENCGLDFESEPDHGRQQIAAIYALGKGSAITLLTGVAGSGKSTLLKPLVTAWKADTRFDDAGRELIGISTAWKQADALQPAGISRTFALDTFLKVVEAGDLAPTRNTILVIDEIGQVAPRNMLKLLELQARTGMTIKALGDREQAQAIEAGDTIELMRRALPKAANPEILSTIRQIDQRDRTIATLFRSEKAQEALEMKREDGSANLIGGDYDQVVAQIAAHYLARRDLLRAAKSTHGITISAPTNEDASAISRAVREQLKARGGELANDETLQNRLLTEARNNDGLRVTAPLRQSFLP